MQKKYKISITASASRDLDEIWEYITPDSKDAVVRFIVKLEAAVKSLERFRNSLLHC